MIDPILKPHVPLRYVCDPSKAGPPLTPLEVHQQRLARLLAEVKASKARIAKLEAALTNIHDFAGGNGDVCELIAKIARRVLDTPKEDAP